MSCSLWRRTENCEGQPCPGDCDLCSYESYEEEDEEEKDNVRAKDAERRND